MSVHLNRFCTVEGKRWQIWVAVSEATHTHVVFQKLPMRGRIKRNRNKGKRKEKEEPTQEKNSQERSSEIKMIVGYKRELSSRIHWARKTIICIMCVQKTVGFGQKKVIHSFNKYLLSTCYFLESVPGRTIQHGDYVNQYSLGFATTLTPKSLWLKITKVYFTLIPGTLFPVVLIRGPDW